LQKTAKHQHINILLLFTSLANQKAVAFSVLMLMLENQGTVSMLQHTRLLADNQKHHYILASMWEEG